MTRERLTEVMSFGCTPTFKNELEEAAARDGVSLADVARQSILRELRCRRAEETAHAPDADIARNADGSVQMSSGT